MTSFDLNPKFSHILKWRGWVEKARLLGYEIHGNEGEGNLGAGRMKGLN